jgi:MFS family permease
MSESKNMLLLALDDAVVTLGGQFREVAVGFLLTTLNPHTAAYAWYFLAGSVPGLVLPRAYAWANTRFAPRTVMTLSYAARIAMALGLWRATTFWAALLLLMGIAAGAGAYSSAQAHFVAHYGDYGATRRVVMRLRQSESLMRLIGPLAAGAILTAAGFRMGFLVSVGAYVAAFALTRQLANPLPHQIPSQMRLMQQPDRAAIAIAALSFLTWQANTLAISYTLRTLHRAAFGYGLTLSIWGGSGFLAAWVLTKLKRPSLTWSAALFALLGAAWAILSLGVGFGPFVLIGGVEGFAAFLVQDLITAALLAASRPGQAGQVRARLGFYNEIGSIAGLVVLLLVPHQGSVLPWWRALSLGAFAAALLFALWGVKRGRDAPLGPTRPGHDA